VTVLICTITEVTAWMSADSAFARPVPGSLQPEARSGTGAEALAAVGTRAAGAGAPVMRH
jgi:hypothetical protein